MSPSLYVHLALVCASPIPNAIIGIYFTKLIIFKFKSLAW